MSGIYRPAILPSIQCSAAVLRQRVIIPQYALELFHKLSARRAGKSEMTKMPVLNRAAIGPWYEDLSTGGSPQTEEVG